MADLDITNEVNSVDEGNEDVTTNEAVTAGATDGEVDGVSEKNTDETAHPSRKRKRDESDDRDMSEVKKAKLNKDQIDQLSFDEKVAMALGYNQELIDKKEWCRYCGSIYSKEYEDSPWGPRKLCIRHHKAWHETKELDLSSYDKEPLKPIDGNANDDGDNLAQIIWKGQESDDNDGMESPEFEF